MGHIAETIATMIMCNPDRDFVYRHAVDGREYELSTKEIREVLGPDVPLSLPIALSEAPWGIDEASERGEHLNAYVAPQRVYVLL